MRIFGMHRRDLHRWSKFGALAQKNCNLGSGSSRLFTAREVVAIRIAQELRAKGFSMTQAGAASKWFLGIAQWDLAQQIMAGRYLILAVGDSLPPPGRLLTEEEVFENAELPFSDLMKLMLPLGVVDVRGTMAKVIHLLEDSPEPITLPPAPREGILTGRSSSARPIRAKVPA